MNDYKFGNLLYELRTKSNLSQTHKKISILFNIDIDKSLQIKQNNDIKKNS